MKKVAINFRINPVYLFLFLLLTLIATTSFGQTSSQKVIEDLTEIMSESEGAPVDLTPQPYGDESLIEMTVEFDDDGTMYVTVTDEDYLGEIIFVASSNGVKDVTAGELPETFDTDSATTIEYQFVPTVDRLDVYFKTTAGVTSVNIIKEGNIHYALCNGKLWGTFVDGSYEESFNGKPADFYKNTVAWQYTPQIEE